MPLTPFPHFRTRREHLLGPLQSSSSSARPSPTRRLGWLTSLLVRGYLPPPADAKHPELYPREATLPRLGRYLGPLVLAKTGPYCDSCQLVIAHRDELEDELTTLFTRLAPEVAGGAYAVLGTVELRAWRRGLSAATTLEDVLRHTTPFTATLTVDYVAATWAPPRPATRSGPDRVPHEKNVSRAGAQRDRGQHPACCPRSSSAAACRAARALPG
jgi:hypothetical protein